MGLAVTSLSPATRMDFCAARSMIQSCGYGLPGRWHRVTVEATRGLPGGKRAPPAERKRERSPLVSPCPLPMGARASRAGKQKTVAIMRARTKRNCKSIKISPFSGTDVYLQHAPCRRRLVHAEPFSFQILIHPAHPATIHIHAPDRITRSMASHGESHKLHWHAIVFKGVVQSVALADGHARVTRVLHD